MFSSQELVELHFAFRDLGRMSDPATPLPSGGREGEEAPTPGEEARTREMLRRLSEHRQALLRRAGEVKDTTAQRLAVFIMQGPRFLPAFSNDNGHRTYFPPRARITDAIKQLRELAFAFDRLKLVNERWARRLMAPLLRVELYHQWLLQPTRFEPADNLTSPSHSPGFSRDQIRYFANTFPQLKDTTPLEENWYRVYLADRFFNWYLRHLSEHLQSFDIVRSFGNIIARKQANPSGYGEYPMMMYHKLMSFEKARQLLWPQVHENVSNESSNFVVRVEHSTGQIVNTRAVRAGTITMGELMAQPDVWRVSFLGARMTMSGDRRLYDPYHWIVEPHTISVHEKPNDPFVFLALRALLACSIIRIPTRAFNPAMPGLTIYTVQNKMPYQTFDMQFRDKRRILLWDEPTPTSVPHRLGKAGYLWSGRRPFNKISLSGVRFGHLRNTRVALSRMLAVTSSVRIWWDFWNVTRPLFPREVLYGPDPQQTPTLDVLQGYFLNRHMGDNGIAYHQLNVSNRKRHWENTVSVNSDIEIPLNIRWNIVYHTTPPAYLRGFGFIKPPASIHPPYLPPPGAVWPIDEDLQSDEDEDTDDGEETETDEEGPSPMYS